MRILVLAPHPFYIDRGTPIDVDILLKALSLRGAQVDVVCLPGDEDRTYEGVEFHRVEGRAFLRQLRPGFSFRKVLADALIFTTAFRLLRRKRFHLIHAGEESVFIAMVFKWVFGVPYVYDMDSSIAQQMVEQFFWLKPLSPLFAWLERRAIRGAAAVAPVCNALADLAARHTSAPIVTLHDISQLQDPDQAPAGLLRERWGIERPVLLYAGNFEPYQGVDLLLEAFALAVEDGSDLDLVLVGGTPGDIEAYRRRARRLGIESRTHFLGPWPNNRIGEMLAEARILSAPRIRGINTPMKIFPYLHSGKPLLATDLPTHSQLLDSSTAMLAPPEPEPFSAAILRLEKDPDLRASLGRNGRALVEANHTFQAHQQRVNHLYDLLQPLLNHHRLKPVGLGPTESGRPG